MAAVTAAMVKELRERTGLARQVDEVQQLGCAKVTQVPF
jgi:translation elongation factor EF-Ts